MCRFKREDDYNAATNSQSAKFEYLAKQSNTINFFTMSTRYILISSKQKNDIVAHVIKTTKKHHKRQVCKYQPFSIIVNLHRDKEQIPLTMNFHMDMNNKVQVCITWSLICVDPSSKIVCLLPPILKALNPF
jgi:hypothetical protein